MAGTFSVPDDTRSVLSLDERDSSIAGPPWQHRENHSLGTVDFVALKDRRFDAEAFHVSKPPFRLHKRKWKRAPRVVRLPSNSATDMQNAYLVIADITLS